VRQANVIVLPVALGVSPDFRMASGAASRKTTATRSRVLIRVAMRGMHASVPAGRRSPGHEKEVGL
jgi:hypothetical protein